MIKYYEIREGLRVMAEDGEIGTIIWVFTGTLSGAVEVVWDNDKVGLSDGTSIVRSHTLRKVD